MQWILYIVTASILRTYHFTTNGNVYTYSRCSFLATSTSPESLDFQLASEPLSILKLNVSI